MTKQKHEYLSKKILECTGTPDDLIRLDIKPLFDDNHFRVNIYREIKGKITLTDSYYINSTQDGLVSSPALEPKYEMDDFLRNYEKDNGSSVRGHSRRSTKKVSV